MTIVMRHTLTHCHLLRRNFLLNPASRISRQVELHLISTHFRLTPSILQQFIEAQMSGAIFRCLSWWSNCDPDHRGVR